MKELEEYLFKTVMVKETNGKTHIGFVDTFTSSADNEEGEESIGILPSREARAGIELFKSEIASIEEVEG